MTGSPSPCSQNPSGFPCAAGRKDVIVRNDTDMAIRWDRDGTDASGGFLVYSAEKGNVTHRPVHLQAQVRE